MQGTCLQTRPNGLFENYTVRAFENSFQLEKLQKFSIQQAVPRLNAGGQQGNNIFKSKYMSPRFISEMLSSCDNSVGPIQILN